MLLIWNEKNTKQNRDFVQPLGEAIRLYYDVRDLKKEVKQGLINISNEDAERLNITREILMNWAISDTDLENAPNPILTWAKEQMKEAEWLMWTFKQQIEKSRFKALTILMFKRRYVKYYDIFKKENLYLFW